MSDWQFAFVIISLMVAVLGLVEMTYRANNAREMFSFSIFLVAVVLLSEVGSYVQNRVSLSIAVYQAQPEWHERRVRLIGEFANAIDKDRQNKWICGSSADPLEWFVHRDRVDLYNGIVTEYQQVIMRYSGGSQYRGVEKTLPQLQEACPAPQRRPFYQPYRL